MTKLIFSTSYFPSVNYFSLIKASNFFTIESKASFIKQTFLNRCEILTANGKMTLSIPIKKLKTSKMTIDEVQISYDTNWQRLHFKALESAYRSSAFFEYYIDAFLPFFTKKYQFLLEFNTEILKILLSELELNRDFHFSEKYLANSSEFIDFRNFEPINGNENSPFLTNQKPYYQVFSNRFPFTENLSIIDLLFNEGPFASVYL
jgi:hypothetical protein